MVSFLGLHLYLIYFFILAILDAQQMLIKEMKEWVELFREVREWYLWPDGVRK